MSFLQKTIHTKGNCNKKGSNNEGFKEFSVSYIKDVYLHEDYIDEEVTQDDLNLVVEQQLRDLSVNRPDYQDLTDSEYDDLQYCVWEDICESYVEDEVLNRDLF